jgi:protease-4
LLYNEPHLITPARHSAICQLVEARMQSPLVETQIQRSRRDDDEEMFQVAATAIIPVHGTIVPHASDIAMSECGCALEELNAKIDMAENNPAITTVIYDFRTPGGTVTGVPETGRKIRFSRKDTIAYCGSECCSGGLWLAAQCQRFYATESSRIGSVGVYTLSLDMSEAMKKDGVKVNAISAGKYKLMGASWKPLTDDEREILQARVDKIYGQFKEAMESFRMVDDRNFGSGLVFDGEEAARMGFTDGVVDGIDEIIDGLVE